MFLKARPIFPAGRSEELNCQAVFRAEVGRLEGTELRLTAAVFYRVFINGSFAGFGPARAAGGYARVDVLPMDRFAGAERNEIVIEVAGYHCRALSTVLQPSFLQAELCRGQQVLACTGQDFEACISPRRLQKVERYSAQRHFGEVWDLCQPVFRPQDLCRTEILSPAPALLPRTAPYPVYRDVRTAGAASRGRLVYDEKLPYHTDFYSFPITDRWGGFAREEIPYHPYEWLQRHRQERCGGAEAFPLTLHAGDYVIVDFGQIETGFFGLTARAQDKADAVLGFSEDGSPDVFAFTDMHVQNVIEYLLPAGERVQPLSFEPYTARYAIFAVRSGSLVLESFGMKALEHPAVAVQAPPTGSPGLDTICRSAIRTFAHNALDIYMDCPSRERAGWLCDSYFTAQTEFALTGRSDTEDAFLENYRLYRSTGEYPDGVLPMCYPSDAQDNHKFIPQWTMWYILELEQYLTLRRPDADREAFRPSVEGLLRFYRQYENADGLLEKLPSWNFVEWSVANDWTQDVSYPTNLLYAQALECVWRLYGDEDCLRRSAEVRRTVTEQAFDGTVFYDHAVRGEDGRLTRCPDCSEACQYYAILFGGMDMNEARWAPLRRLVTGPLAGDRQGLPLPMAEINAFIGAYLRLLALLKLKEYDLTLRETERLFGQMGMETGTLWEYRQRHGSRDHGFASFAYVAIREALDGLRRQGQAQ